MLTQKGYRILKKEIQNLNHIKGVLQVKPFIPSVFVKPQYVKSYSLFEETDEYLYVPKHYGINTFGLYKKSDRDIEKTPDNADVEKYGKDCNNHRNVYSMFYHNKKCMDMINASNMHFDVVVKYRGDIHDVNSEFIIEMPNENTIYIPQGADWGGINDQIAYGNKESMTKYSECVNKMIDYCKSNTRYHPETLLLRHIQEMNLFVKRFNYHYFLNR
jgi:hypothetical protein